MFFAPKKRKKALKNSEQKSITVESVLLPLHDDVDDLLI